MKNYILISLIFLGNLSFGQTSGKEVFERIAKETAAFSIDTTAVPNDRLTEEIKNLRKIKGGFNINEAVLYKIAEDKNKGEILDSDAEKLESYFTDGAGKNELENAVIWIYRKYFSLSEVKKLNKFYRSSAGQKLSQNFPIIMIQSLKAAEQIGEKLKQEAPK